ncbi:DUF3575 domain-containing protein [Chitinophagaceae bacterium MMS25-I14]
MKFSVFFIPAIAFSAAAFSQNDIVSHHADTKNNIKLNLLAFTTRTFSIQYERELGTHISVAMGFRVEPKGGLPFRGFIENQADLSATDTAAKSFINNAKVSNWAITPEFRYYFGKRPHNGFYIAPFARIGNYSLDWNYAFQKDDGTTQNIGFKGNAFAYTFGLLFGAQWHVHKNILIDWWILGPSYGGTSLSLDANTDLSEMTADDKQNLHSDITGISVFGHNIDATVTNSGVTASGHFPFAGVRTGLCIGFSF